MTTHKGNGTDIKSRHHYQHLHVRYIKRANVNNGKIFSSGLNAIYMYILQTRMYRNKN